MPEITKNYKNLTSIEKIFLFIRYITAPFASLSKYLPKKGLILDVGCGPGLLESYFTNKNDKLFFIGIDPDRKKIKIASKLISQRARFVCGYLESFLTKLKFDCITLIDVEYLLNTQEKIGLLNQCIKLLNKDGMILLKTNDDNGSIGFKLGKLQEFFSLKFGITKSNHSINFLTIEEYKSVFNQIGLKVVDEKRLYTRFFHTHYLFVLKRN